MAESPTQHIRLYQSISFKNIVLFLLILLVVLVPLSLRYYQDSRDYEIEILASRLKFFAERGASWLDAAAIDQLREPAQMQSPAYRDLQRTLSNIESAFGVDNAIVMRRELRVNMFIWLPERVVQAKRPQRAIRATRHRATRH